MTTDLDDEIRSFMERGLRHVSAAEAIEHTSHGAATFPAAGFRPRASRARWTVIAAGTAAAACAAGLVASQLGAPGSRPHPHHGASTILTAAYVRHLSRRCRVAPAHARRDGLVSRTTHDGVSEGTSTSDITFSGRNWNDSFRESLPGSGGAASTTQSAINRVVHGQAYDYFVADHGLAWYHDTGPNAIASMAIPDPRKLLSELSPAASFVRVGYTTVDGVSVAHLRATDLSGLPSLQLGNDTPAGQLTSLDIWADSAGVVLRMSVSTSQTEPAGQRYLKLVPKNAAGELKALRKRHPHLTILAQKSGKLIVGWTINPAAAKPRVDRSSVVGSFLDIGQPQVIRPPAHAYVTHGVG